jgi:hypothetical protein
MSDWNSLIERINRHEKAYKETGLIGVYDHVLLKELIEARDEIGQVTKQRDCLLVALEDCNRAAGEDIEQHGWSPVLSHIQEIACEALGLTYTVVSETTKDSDENPEGQADLEMRFEVLIRDYRILHGAMSKMAETNSKPIIHEALRAVNPCWTVTEKDKI